VAKEAKSIEKRLADRSGQQAALKKESGDRGQKADDRSSLGTAGGRGDGDRRRRGEKRPEARIQKVKIYLWERLFSRDFAI
jgi:hypothetical protein